MFPQAKSVPQPMVENGSNMSTGNIIDLSRLLSITAFTESQLLKVKLVFAFIYSSGAIANTILFIYLLYYKRYKSPIFSVILSLCIADLCVCVASLFWICLVPIMILPTWMCKVTMVLLHASFLSSSYHIVLFAALRFFQLVYPLTSRANVTVSLLSKVCKVIWIADLIQALATNVYYKTIIIEYNNENLYICWFTGNRYYIIIWMALTWTILPFLATAGFQISKHIVLICQGPRSTAMAASSCSDGQKRRETDTRALALVLILYLMSLLPTIVQYLRHSLSVIHNTPTEWKVSFISELIVYINSSINPWIYMFAAESVRSDIRKMCAHRSG